MEWRQKTRVLGPKEIAVIHTRIWSVLSTIPRSLDFADELALRSFLRFFEEAKIKGCDNIRVDKGIECLCNGTGKPSGGVYGSFSSPFLIRHQLDSWV